MKIKFLNCIDYFLLICVSFLVSLGIAFIYSSAIDSNGTLTSYEYAKQAVWFGIGLVFMMFFAAFDYRKLSRYSPYIFIAFGFLLVLILIFGTVVNGAKSWIGIGSLGIQPSEFTKISFILFLARYLSNSLEVDPLKRFLTSIIIMSVPMGLILLQPDMGTATVFIPIFLCMCFMADIPVKYLLVIVSFGLLTILFTVIPIWGTEFSNKPSLVVKVLVNTKIKILLILASISIAIIGIFGSIIFEKKYFRWISEFFGVVSASLLFSIFAGLKLKGYQIKRLIVFIDPSIDPLNSGWNIIQSKTAIGSGNFFGRGFLKGTQSHLKFLPEQSTDFIFSIFSEETGFVGGVLMFLVYLAILLRVTYIMRRTTNHFSTYICSGILGMLFFHFVVNVGMVMGMMPITGIPLSFMSYGGSALLSNMIAIGLVMSINSRRLDFSSSAL